MIPSLKHFALPAFFAFALFASSAHADAPTAPTTPSKPTVTKPTSPVKKPQPRRIAPLEIDTIVRGAIAQAPLTRGASLVTVHANAVDADAYDKVTLDVPVLPRKAGPMTVTATLAFLSGGNPIARTTVRLDVVLPPEAALAPIPRGAPITLSIRKGLVEVNVAGVAGADSDIGAPLPVVLKPSGRIIRARSIDKDHAVAEEW